MDFIKKLEAAIEKNNSLVCVGLDSAREKLPQHLGGNILAFNKAIIDVTHDLVSSYKINIAFYAADGLEGLKALQDTIEYIHATSPKTPVILDAKRADIGNTSEAYAKEVFDFYKADAVTVNPFMGFDTIEPFLKHEDKGIIVLCRTSNTGAKDFQDLSIDGIPLYMKIADKVNEWNSLTHNCLLVVGATYPSEMQQIRNLAPDMFFLVPGIGAQGGSVEETLGAGLRADKSGLLIHAARSIIYAGGGEDFIDKTKDETMKLREKINKYR